MLGKCHILMTFSIEDRKKGPGVDIEGKYPPRSHDCMPPEIEFANSFVDAQEDVERRKKREQTTDNAYVAKCD